MQGGDADALARSLVPGVRQARERRVLVLLFLLREQCLEGSLVLWRHGGRSSGAFLGGEVALVLPLPLEAVDAGLRDSEAVGDDGARLAGLQGGEDALAQIERESFHKGSIPELSILSVKTI